MSKTWETLFNLSSFMKYLLSKDLPNEKLEAPSYVLDSLYDLLTITSSWIDKIKPVANDLPSLKNQFAQHSAQVLLSSRNNGNIEGSTAQVNLQKDYSANDSSSSTAAPPSDLSSQDVHISKVARLVNPSQEIPESFMKLSKEMINGRPFGYYCRPCDESYFSKKEWDDHLGDRLHTFLIDCEVLQGSCVYCKFIVFATNKDINNLFKYHEEEHRSRNHNILPIVENIPKKGTNKISSKNKDDFSKTDFDVTNKVDTDVNYNLKTTQRISPVFIELDKRMHSGQEKGFYCQFCDGAFEEVAEWNNHFQEVAVHNDQHDKSGCFEKCESCNLVIFAIPSIQKWYKSHHMCGHYCFKEGKKGNLNFKSSVESLQSTGHSQENVRSYKHSGPRQNNQSTNSYKISQKFMDFNAMIHNRNLLGHYYCRPCNFSLSPEEWIKHSVNKKHLELMANKKFKNWKGTCAYCSLTIIGTRDTVKYYMEYHSVPHNKVVSYDLQNISSYNTPSSYTRRKHLTRKLESPNSVSTFDDEEDGSDSEDKDVDNMNNEASSISPDVGGETSWYASSRDEQLYNSIRQLIDSRTKQKYTTGNPEFGGLCTLCEFTTNNAFEWQDHISFVEHLQRMTPQDRQGFLNDLNIYLFASINVFEKYRSLVKGNWSFIDN